MRLNFPIGLLAGILLASVLVVASSYSSSPSVLGPAVPSATTFQAATTTATTTATTRTSSSTTQPSSPTSVQSSLSNLSASAGAGNSASKGYSTTPGPVLASGISDEAPSSLTSIVNQPGQAPLLLLPVLAALLIGFAFYRASVQKE